AEQAAERLRGPEQAHWLERLDQEAANLNAALAGATGFRLVNALGWYWYLRGRFGDARRALAEALSTERRPSPARTEAETWLTAFT
ncbi:hypothetical protein G3I24_20730, partial [Micromonospora aurantiaca]|nr:hypothetical protein [Micromonospora aurantiaca]